MKKEQIKKLAETRQSFYIYEEEKIAEHLDALKKALPEVNFLYSVKINPHPEVVKAVLSRGLAHAICEPRKTRGDLYPRGTIKGTEEAPTGASFLSVKAVLEHRKLTKKK